MSRRSLCIGCPLQDVLAGALYGGGGGIARSRSLQSQPSRRSSLNLSGGLLGAAQGARTGASRPAYYSDKSGGSQGGASTASKLLRSGSEGARREGIFPSLDVERYISDWEIRPEGEWEREC